MARKSLVKWTESEKKIVAEGGIAIWRQAPNNNETFILNKSVHIHLTPDRWRKLASFASCPEVFGLFRRLQLEAIASIDKPSELVHVHTKEEVMLPPEQAIKFAPTQIIIGELSTRLANFVDSLTPLIELAKVQLAQPVPHSKVMEPIVQPKIVQEKQKEYKVAIIGLLQYQFEHVRNQVSENPALKDMFKLKFIDKDANKINLGIVDYVLETRHIGHTNEKQVISQMGGSDRIKFCTSGSLIQELFNLRSRLIAENNR